MVGPKSFPGYFDPILHQAPLPLSPYCWLLALIESEKSLAACCLFASSPEDPCSATIQFKGLKSSLVSHSKHTAPREPSGLQVISTVAGMFSKDTLTF